MADVILKLIIDGKEFDAKIKDADKQIAGLKKDVQKHSVDMTASLKNVASAMGLAFGAQQVFSFLKDSLNAYMDSEAALKKLEVALGRNAGALSDYAAELQKVTAFEDDEIVKAMALLSMYNKNEDQIKQLTKVVLDFAAAKDVDLVSAADLVSKTIGTEVNALGRYGVQVQGAVGSTERFNSLMEGMARFSGQAAAQLETTAGQIKNFQNQWDDFMEKTGEALLPYFQKLIETLKTTKKELEFIQDVFNGISNFLTTGSLSDKSLKSVTEDLKKDRSLIEGFMTRQLATTKKIVETKKEEVKTERELWDIREKNMREEKEYWEDFYNEYMKSNEGLSSKPGARGKPETDASAPIKELTDFQKQSMGVMMDTTDAMWRNLVIGGRQAVDQWDAIWLAFRNSALQRIGEIVQNEVWDFLFSSIFSIFSGGVTGGVDGAASAVISGASPSSAVINSKLNVNLDAKLIGEDIYLSNKRVTQRRSDNSL